MVREASRREKKYEAKVDAEVLSRQTTALKPLMVKGQRDYFPQITSLEQRIKRLVEAKGVTTLQVRDYLNFGREMLDLSKRFSGTTLNAEAQLKVNKWSERGLDGSTLVEVAQLVGITPIGFPLVLSPFDFIMEGRYYTDPTITAALGSTLTVGKDLLRASRFPLTKKVSFDRIGFYNSYTVGVGARARVGVYDSATQVGYTYHPNNLLLDSGEINVEAAGWKYADIDLTLEKGLYWLAVLTNSSSMGVRATTSSLRILGAYEIDAILMYPLNGFIYILAYGALPSVFPLLSTESYYALALALRVKKVL